ncbi:MAG: hypothetical protein JXB04_09655 [Kiritimatiellae bacterium]|nr:hypothetical protein [Kiritimatiellia bacterium]
MAMEEPSAFFGLTDGCPVHGDEFMKECSMCGAEFCARCHPKWTVCPDCADEPDAESEDTHADDADFEDVRDVGALLEDDEAMQRVLGEADEDLPPEDLPAGDDVRE